MENRDPDILARIRKTGDVKNIPAAQLPELAEEIRRLLVRVVSRRGGHLASNLGVVELTIALHRVLDLERDTLLWDVGHQAYTHKILTGRRKAFENLRTYGGLSGFPAPEESATDPFKTGHSSTSIAAALGIACAGSGGRVVAVIGDASLGGGAAFEGLNKAACLKADISIILNANEMAISPTTGGLAFSLARLITNRHLEAFRRHSQSMLQKVPLVGAETVNFVHNLEEGVKNLLGPSALFESLGLRYFGPFDGHSPRLGEVLSKIIPLEGPKLIHVVTSKGKGYAPAERDPEAFHSTGPFDPETGAKTGADEGTYREVFTGELLRQAEKDPRLAAVTAAMCAGCGLTLFARRYPERFYDIGIAEQAAVAFAGGLARAGRHPVTVVYATFFQRALDQVFQEICLQGLPALFVLPNAGLAGEDGPTHHGVFSLATLRCLPGLEISAPCSYGELRRNLGRAFTFTTPAVILFPKDQGPEELAPVPASEPQVLLVALGAPAAAASRAADHLRREGWRVFFLPVSRVKPADPRIAAAANTAKLVVTVEEGALPGGFGSSVRETLADQHLHLPVRAVGLPDQFVTFGSRAELLAETGLDEDGIYRQVRQELEFYCRRPADGEKPGRAGGAQS